MRPYSGPSDKTHRGPYHDFAWRGWWDFGTGAIGDMACHTGNMAFMALEPGTPDASVGRGRRRQRRDLPELRPRRSWSSPPARTCPPVTLHWYEGKKDGKKLTPPEELCQKAIALDTNQRRKRGLVASGSILVGSKGIAYSPDDYGAEVFFSTGEVANNSSKLETFPINNGGDQGQKNEWVEAIKAGKPEMAHSNFDYAGPPDSRVPAGQRRGADRRSRSPGMARSAWQPTARTPPSTSAASTARAGI